MHGDSRSDARSTRQVYAALRREIPVGPAERRRPACRARPSSGGRSGPRASPSDARCATSRPPGLVERRAGSGTYVQALGQPAAGLSFGLLIPDLGETEIFEPICQGMMASPLAREHALVWGSPNGGDARRRIAPGSCAGSTSTGGCPACSSRRSS